MAERHRAQRLGQEEAKQVNHQRQNQQITRRTEAAHRAAEAEERETVRCLQKQGKQNEAILHAALAGDSRAVAHAANRMLISHPGVGRYEYQGMVLGPPDYHHAPETCPFCGCDAQQLKA